MVRQEELGICIFQGLSKHEGSSWQFMGLGVHGEGLKPQTDNGVLLVFVIISYH